MSNKTEQAERIEECFAEIIVELGLITDEELQKCLKLRQKQIVSGKSVRLGEVMMAEKLITKSQALEILKKSHISLGDTRKIGGYELLGKLGEGAMGAVYKARQVSMDRIVALKLLPRSVSKDKIALDRFLREARLVAKLSHPNIIRGFEVGEANGYNYFAMEYVDGGTIGEQLRKIRLFAEPEIINIGKQTALALAHAHTSGIIHRDVKPDNIMLTNLGNTVKLADLGLATREGVKHLTATGSTVGTPYYMSPEQVTGKSNQDSRTDIYSLGATLYHLAVGQPPFTANSIPALMSKRLSQDPPPPFTKNSNISRQLSAVILKMMARKPEERYQTCNEIIEDLEVVTQGKDPVCMDLLADYKNNTSSKPQAPASLAEALQVTGKRHSLPPKPTTEVKILPKSISILTVEIAIGILVTGILTTWTIRHWKQIRGATHPDKPKLNWKQPPQKIKNTGSKAFEFWQQTQNIISAKNLTLTAKRKALQKLAGKFPKTIYAKRARKMLRQLNQEDNSQ